MQRVSDCLKGPNHRILDVSIDGGKWFAIKVLKENEELSKKENVKEECVVPAVPASGWRSFPSYDIPVLFNYGHIYYYALESIRTVQLDPSLDVRDEDINKENEMECGLGHMTDKPLKNGRKYVDSKFVHDLMDTKTEQHYFLKGHVWPSMRAELPHNVLIIRDLKQHHAAINKRRPSTIFVIIGMREKRDDHMVRQLFAKPGKSCHFSLSFTWKGGHENARE